MRHDIISKQDAEYIDTLTQEARRIFGEEDVASFEALAARVIPQQAKTQGVPKDPISRDRLGALQSMAFDEYGPDGTGSVAEFRPQGI